jgi:hypothetical protein
MRCHLCHGRFGLVRHRLVTFGGPVQFCSKKCLEAYRERLHEEVKKRKFQAWLDENGNARRR